MSALACRIPAASDSDALAREHLPLAHALAWKLSRGFDIDEVRGDAELGLAQAIATYRPERGAAFKSWAYLKIAGAIRDGQRRRDHLGRNHRRRLAGGRGLPFEQSAVSLDSVTPTTDHITPADGLVAPGLDLLESTALRDALRTLSPREEFIVLARDAGMTGQEIGDLLGVTESRITQLHGVATRKLRAELEER